MVAHSRRLVLLLATLSVGGCADLQTSTGDRLARVADIHAGMLTLDTHKDIQPQLAPRELPQKPDQRLEFRRRYDPTFRGSQQVDFPKMREGGYDAAFFIVYVGQGSLNRDGYGRAYAAAIAKFDAIDRMVELHGDQIELARTPDDVERIIAAGRLCCCIGIENGYPMGLQIERIAEFHARGARYMSIAHNRHNQLGDSHTPADPLHGGLSELGRQAVAEMNRVGIMVDISHASKASMMQVLAESKAPVIASHSGCRAICDHTRNLDDEQLLALKRNGGVIQCVALKAFVKDETLRRQADAALRKELGLPARFDAQNREVIPDFEAKMATYRERFAAIDAQYPRATVADFVDHIDHAVELIGIDHVGIASDFDGGGGIIGWENAAETMSVTAELVRRGYSDEDIAKIWSGNTLRVWREVERIAAELQPR